MEAIYFCAGPTVDTPMPASHKCMYATNITVTTVYRKILHRLTANSSSN